MSTDFSSLDRLMEFGMSLGVAQQMIATMNSAMNQMQVAGVNARTTGQAALNAPAWYVVVDGRQAGPLTGHELRELVEAKQVGEQTLMWRAGMSAWQPARNIPEVNKILLLSK